MTAWQYRVTGFVVWSLLLVSVVPWRQGVYYDGGLDTVVLAKASLQGLALAIAAGAALTGTGRPVAAGPVLLLFLFAAVSLVGAANGGELLPSAVLAVRLILAGLTAVLVLRALPGAEALGLLLAAMGAVGAVAAVGGVGELLDGGRLEGGILPLSPNLIALLAAAPGLGCVHLVLRGRRLALAVPGALVLGAAVLATGSRTGIAVMAAAVLVNVLYLGRIRQVLAVLFLAAVPLVVGVAFFTPLVSSLLMRPDSASLLTLNSRTIAWEAVLSTPPGTWTWWVGEGLSVKTVPVQGQYWDEQVLDSSWVSAFAQAGVAGVLVLALWVLAAVSQAFANRGIPGGLPPTLLTFIVGRSALENGLTEASAALVLFFVIALIVARPGQAPDATGVRRAASFAAASSRAGAGRQPWSAGTALAKAPK